MHQVSEGGHAGGGVGTFGGLGDALSLAHRRLVVGNNKGSAAEKADLTGRERRARRSGGLWWGW